MHSPPDGAPPGAHDPPDLDPQDVLGRDPHVLLDAGFCGQLHARLARECAPEAVAPTLLRMGFLHGLAHALRACAADRREGGLVPPLVMRYRLEPRAGGLALRGSWPQAVEAASRLAAGAGRAADACALSAGYTSGWLSGIFDRDLLAVEQTCSADGQVGCCFLAREADAWRDEGGRAADWLAALPFAADRALVRARVTAGRLADPSPRRGETIAGIDRGSACVHIWGPVMVLPFGGAEEGLRTLDLLGHDPEAQRVSVVVVDLADAIIDPAFGALALELIVRTAEAWGAETLFAEPSALSEPVLAELDHPPLLVMKGLEQAIATAFQIASVQQRSL